MIPMVRSEPVQFAVGDVVKLKKAHPCGGFDWTVVRLGADIGVKCQTCGRRVLLPRRDLERRVKTFVTRSASGGNELTAGEPIPSTAVSNETSC
jgi:hypothetical protein